MTHTMAPLFFSLPARNQTDDDQDSGGWDFGTVRVPNRGEPSDNDSVDDVSNRSVAINLRYLG
jgi:hypothetical protein